MVRVAWELVTIALPMCKRAGTPWRRPPRCARCRRSRPAAALIDRPGPVITPRVPHIWGERHLAPVSLLTSVPGTVPNSIGARMTTSVQQHRALRLLADAPHGRTVADMLAHGFTNALLDRLARDGLATIQPGTICTSTRRYRSKFRRGGREARCRRLTQSGRGAKKHDAVQQGVSTRGTGTMGYAPGAPRGFDQSTLIPANLITLPHFSASSTISLPKPAVRRQERHTAKVGEPCAYPRIGPEAALISLLLVDDLGGTGSGALLRRSKKLAS